MDADLLELMPDTITWRRKTGQNVRQQPTWAAPVSIRCLVADGLTEVIDSNGAKQDARGTIYCGGVFAINPADELTMPAGGKPKILTVNQFSDENGAYATVVYIG